MRALDILVVDDNPAIARFIVRTLKKLGHRTAAPCHRLADVPARVAEMPPDLVLMDLDMGGESSVPTMERIADAGIPVVCITGFSADVRPTPAHIPRLTKPIDEQAIAGLIADLSAGADPDRSSLQRSAPATDAGRAGPSSGGWLPPGTRRLQLREGRLREVDGLIPERIGERNAEPAVALAGAVGIPLAEASAAQTTLGAHLVSTVQGAAVLLAAPARDAGREDETARDFTLVPLASARLLANDLASLGRAAREIGLGPGFVFWETDVERRVRRVERDRRGARIDLEAMLLGRRLDQVFTPSAADGSAANPLAAALAAGERFQDVRIFLPAAGAPSTATTWRFTGLPLFDDEGRFAGFRGVAQDDGFQRFIDGVPLSILIWSEDHRILASNRTLHEVLGLPRAAVIGLDFDSFVARLDITLDDPAARLDPRTMDGARFWVRGADGAMRCQVTRTTRIETRAGSIYMAIYLDMTDSITAERDAHAADLARLSASAAHDIGNAVTILDGVVASLVDGDRATREALAEDMKGTLAGMRDLLGRLQHLAAAGASEADIDPEDDRNDIRALADRVVRLLGHQYPQLELRVVVPEAIGELRPAAPAVDLERALTNLLTNAIEACGPRGRIRLSLDRVVRQNRGHGRMTVEDDGPGFAPELGARALDVFVSTKGTGNAGLGLFQVSTFVRRYGGEIRLGRSAELGGARVEISLPLLPD